MRLSLLALLVLGLAAHLSFWYWPRVHAARPVADGLAESILRDPGYDVAIWLPYPHQNLAALERTTGDLEELAAAIARLSGAPPPVLPRLGPFRFPPAREMVWASSADGRRWEAAVRLFPSVAVLLRAAGRVAANPWLAGGSVQAATGELYVEWHGSTWLLASDRSAVERRASERSSAPAMGAREKGDPYVGLLHLARPHGLLPAGMYRIRRAAGALEITMGRPAPDALRSLADLNLDGATLMALHRGPAGPDRAVEALAILPAEPGHSSRLPSAVLLSRGGAGGLGLPGEASLRRLGIRPRELRIGTWTLSGWDDPAIRFGRAMIPQARRWAQSRGDEVTLLSLDVAAIGRWAAGVGAGLQQLPLVGQGVARPWEDAARVAAACGPSARLLAAVDAAGPGVEIRLEPAGGSTDRH